MKISLDTFEQKINETILTRGFQYFKRGRVVDVVELERNEYEAIVKGTENYTVNLTVKEGMVDDYVCTCPYDMGPVCKHVVAVLFYLQQDELEVMDIPVTKTKASASAKQPKKKSIVQQIDELLDVIPESELKEFIRDTCKTNKEFRSRLLVKYACLVSPLSKEGYVDQIINFAEVHSDRYGMIDYSHSKHFSQAVLEILEQAQGAINEDDPKRALPIVFAAIETLPAILSYADDSNGYIGGCIYEAFELLEKIIEIVKDEPLRGELFDLLLKTSKQENLKGWGWDSTFISYAIDMIKTADEKAQILTLLSKVKPTGDSWDSEYRKAQELILELKEKTEDADAVITYLKENISNADFREKLIEQAIKVKDYSQALQFANEGLLVDGKGRNGKQWMRFQLQIYQLMGDKENIIPLAYYFVLNGYEMANDYKLLKKTVPAGLWKDYLKKLIADLYAEKQWFDYDKISSVYIWEKMWDEYFTLLKNNVDFRNLEVAEKYLANSYADELVALYAEQILLYMEQFMGRKYYIEVCRYMRRMKKLGGGKTVDQLIETLRTTYKNRRALLEELDNV